MRINSRICGIAGIGLMLMSANAAQGVDSKPSTNPAQTKEIMNGIYASMRQVLPMSLNDKSFYDPKNRAEIQKHLDNLSKSSHLLTEHSKVKDESFKFVSQSFQRDSREVANWFREGRTDEARYMLHNITENCISCHMKGSGTGKFPATAGFFDNIDIASLNDMERARLQIATRQFDEAMKTYESVFESKKLAPSDLIFLDAFSDYLKVSIRVQRDNERPLKVLEKYRATQKLPQFVDTQLADWIDALKDLNNTKAQKPSLETARSWMAKAQTQMKFPRDRDGMIYFIAASGTLNDLISADSLKKEQLAEAYYMLGYIEEIIGRSFWVSQSEYMLEAAIRTAPKSRHARDAYALLEENVYLDYSGSSGTNIPNDVQKNLDELKKLIEQK
jgi:hypothetical protein